jgi:hypothetical protein
VFAINPMSVVRYRERHSTSGAKSDGADAHVLAGDSDQGEAIKLTARTHRSLIWDRTCHVLRPQSALREFFPAGLQAFPDLDARTGSSCCAAHPTPTRPPSRAGRRSAPRCAGTVLNLHHGPEFVAPDFRESPDRALPGRRPASIAQALAAGILEA